MLQVHGHTLRGFNTIALGYHPEIEAEPWTVTADGKPLFTFDLTMPIFTAVSAGGGRSYVLITGSQGPGTTDIVWIADMSGPAVVVSRPIEGCVSPKGRVSGGAFILGCARTTRTPMASPTFKDGVLH